MYAEEADSRVQGSSSQCEDPCGTSASAALAKRCMYSHFACSASGLDRHVIPSLIIEVGRRAHHCLDRVSCYHCDAQTGDHSFQKAILIHHQRNSNSNEDYSSSEESDYTVLVSGLSNKRLASCRVVRVLRFIRANN